MTTETVFLDTADVKVTNARLVVKGKTYALSGVTSFRKTSKEIPQTSKGMLWLLLILAVIVLVLPAIGYAIGNPSIGGLIFIAIAAGVVWMLAQKIKGFAHKYLHTLYLSVASGEVAAYETPDGSFATSIENALTNAVIHRG